MRTTVPHSVVQTNPHAHLPDEVVCWAAWKPTAHPAEAAEAEEAEEAEEAGKAQPGTTKDIVLYLSGENDDYVSDLMETLTSKINHYLQQRRRGPHSLSTAYSMKPKQINLLYHIESGERFEKFLRRDFSAVADNILGSLPEEPPPLPPLPVPPKTKAKKARVEASNQGTSGTSELATASSAALSTASAVPLDTSDTPALGSAPQVALVGRGRGRDNRPAWMTEHNGSVPGAAPANVVVVAAAVTADDAGVGVGGGGRGLQQDVAPTMMVGRGRGRDNRPAWMMDSNTPPSASSTAMGDDSVPPPQSKRKREGEEEDLGTSNKKKEAHEAAQSTLKRIKTSDAAEQLLGSLALPPRAPRAPPPPTSMNASIDEVTKRNVFLENRVVVLEKRVGELESQLKMKTKHG